MRLRSPGRKLLLFATFAISSSVVVEWSTAHRRRLWQPQEVPIAFWAWRTEAPSEADVGEAIRRTGARTLFLRAGQIDCKGETVERIRRLTGAIPGRIDVHLVYNATPRLLEAFESTGLNEISDGILSAFDQDLNSEGCENVNVVGLQLDFDVPTRLLPKYAQLLAAVRSRVPRELMLSITGLPTWMDSPRLKEPLSACDFWIPQCYGAEIPRRVEQAIPITSTSYVARAIARARAFGHPFYAGLAAYGYSVHYSRGGSLMDLWGDLDPRLVLRNDDLQLVESRALEIIDRDTGKAGAWRAVYRARRDTAVNGTGILAGESLVLECPTAEGLRACARQARQQAGCLLQGICVFRFPTRDDATTLSLPEIASALKEAEPTFSMNGVAERTDSENKRGEHNGARIILTNDGSVAFRGIEGSLSLVVSFPVGDVRSISSDELDSIQPVFEAGAELNVCMLKRANAAVLSTRWWPPGAKITIRIEFNKTAPDDMVIRCIAFYENARVRATRTLRLDRLRHPF